jgi:hypothetical protein
MVSVSLYHCVSVLGGVVMGMRTAPLLYILGWPGDGVECKLGNVTPCISDQTALWKFVDALSFLLLEYSPLRTVFTARPHSQHLAYLPSPLIFSLEPGRRQVFPFDNSARHTNFLFRAIYKVTGDAPPRHRTFQAPSHWALPTSSVGHLTGCTARTRRRFVSCFFKVPAVLTLHQPEWALSVCSTSYTPLSCHGPAILHARRSAPVDKGGSSWVLSSEANGELIRTNCRASAGLVSKAGGYCCSESWFFHVFHQNCL